ncbi:P-type conjugative transfer protein TrbL [Desulfomicrobium orale]|uniref:Conjugal transfer protein TrbL n=1 Tax=Desulfomicrobium orale DSM 12838 TaxID=888061 RepID=A0A0X8JRV7_9BACT|nr:P-type conjugative transfer protein TrbL [Desulfomicrobium orale]AMD93388.1 hypothetical protein AXF15_09955 [Desulfomicrobium orale DSM 12838]
MDRISKTIPIFLFIIFLLLISVDAFAELTNDSILESVVVKYKSAAEGWKDYMMDRARWLFFVLGIISMIWTFGQLLFHRSSLAEYAGELIRFCIFFGFYLWLLENGPKFAGDIINSFTAIGAGASKQNITGLSSVVDVGFEVFEKARQGMSYSNPTGSLGLLLIGAGVLIIISLIAVNMLILYCSGWILCYAGIIYLGLGGCKWTSDMAINYFKTVLGVAASLMTTILLIGIAKGILMDQVSKISTEANLTEFAVILVSAITLLFLTNKVPAMVSGIITGASIGAASGAAAFGGGFVGAAVGSSFSNVAGGASSFATGLAATGAVAAGGYAKSAAQSVFGKLAGSGGKSQGLDTSKIGGKPTGSTPV